MLMEITTLKLVKYQSGRIDTSLFPFFKISYTPHTHLNTELYASVPNEVALEYFEMNTNDAYGTNTADIATTGNVAYTAEIATTENVAYMTAGIATTGNVAYMTAEDTIPATQNVAYGQVPPATDESYEYVRCD